jgi:7,8-dihydro-6-hydroxymethylpterin dimethyltransferase
LPMADAGPGDRGRASGPMFLDRARTHTLSVSAMAFQDAWNLDLERVRDCCIHVLSPGGRLIPFCLYNLTDAQGRGLHRS